MKKLIYVLSGLLAAQLVLTAILDSGSNRISSRAVDKPLLALNASKIDSIQVNDAKGNALKLVLANHQWQLADHDNFAANQQQVQQLLAELSTLKHGESVADTDSAATRFKVAPKTFERKIVLREKGTDMATLYIGTSASMRETHVRVDGEDDIYLANVPVYQLPTSYTDWVNHDALQLKAKDIQSISFDGVTLSRTAKDSKTADGTANMETKMVAALSHADAHANKHASGWQLVPMKASEQLNTAGLDAVVHQLTALRIGKLLGTSAKADYHLDTPIVKVSVKRKSGDDVSYTLAALDKGQGFVLKSSLSPEYFQLPAEQGKAIVEAFQPSKLSHTVVAKNNADKANAAPSKPKLNSKSHS